MQINWNHIKWRKTFDSGGCGGVMVTKTWQFNWNKLKPIEQTEVKTMLKCVCFYDLFTLHLGCLQNSREIYWDECAQSHDMNYRIKSYSFDGVIHSPSWMILCVSLLLRSLWLIFLCYCFCSLLLWFYCMSKSTCVPRMDVVGGISASVGLFEYVYCICMSVRYMQFQCKNTTITAIAAAAAPSKKEEEEERTSWCELCAVLRLLQHTKRTAKHAYWLWSYTEFESVWACKWPVIWAPRT